MGQMKKLLDTIMELDESIYPDDLHMDYEIWLFQKEQQERLLSSEKELILQEYNFQTHE